MSYRIMFLVIAAAVAALLLNAGGTINDIAAIIVAAGARPFFQSMRRVFERSGALNFLRAADLDSEDTDHNLSTDPAFEDRTPAH